MTLTKTCTSFGANGLRNNINISVSQTVWNEYLDYTIMKSLSRQSKWIYYLIFLAFIWRRYNIWKYKGKSTFHKCRHDMQQSWPSGHAEAEGAAGPRYSPKVNTSRICGHTRPHKWAGGRARLLPLVSRSAQDGQVKLRAGRQTAGSGARLRRLFCRRLRATH
jgi:hypothetical protein